MTAIEQHYTRPGLGEAILAALAAAGRDLTALRPEDFAPLDQFHSGGATATRELLALADLAPGATVLDVGGGLGGPARLLAQERRCRVTVLDLTEEFCRAGQLLTERVGLSEWVSFVHSDALMMPFPDSSFDAVWTQHSSMNIADKERLYQQIRRVIRPNGRLAIHEIMAGPGGAPHFPTPFARDATMCDLRPPAAMRTLLAASFHERVWEDVTGSTLTWLQRQVGQHESPPPAGFHLLQGDQSRQIGENFARSLVEGRLAIIRAVLTPR